jgi:hypothetical protein
MLRKLLKGEDEMADKDLPRQVMIPLPEQRVSEYAPPVPRYNDEDEEQIMVAAATAHRRTLKTIDELKHELAQANARLAAKESAMNELKVLLSQERNHVEGIRAEAEAKVRHYRDERDRVIQDRSDLLALFANVFTQLERFELPIRIKRHPAVEHNGSGDTAELAGASGAVPDEDASREEVSK